jgi:hypothetical protein
MCCVRVGCVVFLLLLLLCQYLRWNGNGLDRCWMVRQISQEFFPESANWKQLSFFTLFPIYYTLYSLSSLSLFCLFPLFPIFSIFLYFFSFSFFSSLSRSQSFLLHSALFLRIHFICFSCWSERTRFWWQRSCIKWFNLILREILIKGVASKSKQTTAQMTLRFLRT